ncbi:Uncharacterised protein [Mycobacteroides abscessus subsp. abscessus]|nr:Uncharacterised protein [Mycobacteroides abscessus subsp. abscessus]
MGRQIRVCSHNLCSVIVRRVANRSSAATAATKGWSSMTCRPSPASRCAPRATIAPSSRPSRSPATSSSHPASVRVIEMAGWSR